MLETRQDRSLDYVLARRMTRISAAKIICIHNKLITVNLHIKRLISEANFFSHLISFVSLTFSLVDRLYSSSFVFVQSKRRLLHKRFARKKCFCGYVIQRQATFSPRNNPPSQRNCKLLCHNNNWAIYIPDPTTIEHGCETDTKWTRLLSWKHLIDVHQNLVFQMGKKIVEGRVWLVTALRWLDGIKNDDIHQKYDVFRNIILKPFNTCKKHFEVILLNLPLDECKIQGN